MEKEKHELQLTGDAFGARCKKCKVVKDSYIDFLGIPCISDNEEQVILAKSA